MSKTTFKRIVALSALLLMSVSGAFAADLGKRTLYKGIAGDDVAQLQGKLNSLGYSAGRVDGVFGSITEQSVMLFQAANKLPKDGKVNSDELSILINKNVKQDGKVLDIVATAYAPGPHDNGKWGNLTHMGTQVRPGVIAVDPRVIPLGTRVYIEGPNGLKMHAIAEDTGGLSRVTELI